MIGKKSIVIILIITSLVVFFVSITFKNSPTDNIPINIIDIEFGEYTSPGNTWIEITHSAANPPAWKMNWSINNPGEYYPKEWREISGERKQIQQFYVKHDIEILDVIHSGKNAQLCEATSCIWGTYHLLVSNQDYNKFQELDFGFIGFGDSGITESSITHQPGHTAKWDATKISIATNGDFELELELEYESKNPMMSGHYCKDCKNSNVTNVDLEFVNSVVFLSYPYSGNNAKVMGIIAENISLKQASISYSGKLEITNNNPLHHNYGSIGLGWVRIFEDSNGERYYQWLRSKDMTMLQMNSKQTAKGIFNISAPFPEFAHKHNFTFDYVSWIKENVYGNKALPTKNLGEKVDSKGSFPVILDKNKLEVFYEITEDNEVSEIIYTPSSHSPRLFIALKSYDSGILTLTVPKELIPPAVCQENVSYRNFVVRTSHDIDYEILNANQPEDMILQIPFESDDNDIMIITSNHKSIEPKMFPC